MQPPAVKEQIARHFSDLSPQLRRAAQFVSGNMEDVASHSLRKIAGKSGLTPPTYSRLARAIGFEHYEALRESCRAEMREKRMSLAERASLLQEENSGATADKRGGFANRHAFSAVASIQNLLDNLDTDQLADAVDALAAADKVYLCGAMSSRTMIEYLSYVANMVTDKWQVVGQGASSGPAALAGIRKDDIVLVLAIAPYASETVRSVQFATDAGAKVIVVSDNLLSPLLKYATFAFLIPTQSPQFFPSHVAVVTFLEILAGMFVARLGKKGQQRIRAVELLNHAIGDYWEQ